jgi:rRNA maturation endonuclease Nob1
MIYRCEGNSCQYLFEADSPGFCPDCGNKQIRPATETELAEYHYYRQHYGYYGKEESSTDE